MAHTTSLITIVSHARGRDKWVPFAQLVVTEQHQPTGYPPTLRGSWQPEQGDALPRGGVSNNRNRIWNQIIETESCIK